MILGLRLTTVCSDGSTRPRMYQAMRYADSKRMQNLTLHDAHKIFYVSDIQQVYAGSKGKRNIKCTVQERLPPLVVL